MKLAAVKKRLAGMLYTEVHDALYELEIHQAITKNQENGCRLLTVDDSSLLRVNYKAEKVEEFLNRLHDSIGFVCEANDGAIAGYAWASAKTRENEGEYPFFYRIAPQSGDLYIFDVFVDPTYRGQGVATRLMKSVVSYALKEGYSRCFTLHDARNNAMIKISENTGFRRIGTLTYKRIGFWKTRDTSELKARS